METINERIKKIFDTLNMSQSDFARKINVTPAYVWKILNKNESTPSDRLIEDICQKFLVNEPWLRTGQGGDENMFKKDFPNDEYMAYATLIGNGANDRIKEAIIKYGRLSPDNKKIIDDAIELIVQMLKKEE